MAKKKIWIIVAVFAMLFGITGVAGATAVSDPFNQDLSNVRFWALDDPEEDNDADVTFSVIFYGGGTVQYSTDNSSWSNFNNGTSLTVDEKELVYLRLQNDSSYDYSGKLQFSGFDRNYYGLDAYNSLLVDWGDGSTVKLSFITPTGGDDVAPVPLPSSALFLFSGLLGLVAFGSRRKILK